MTNDPKNDPRFHLGSIDLIKNEDGSFKVTSTEGRLGVYTSSGYDQNQITTLDQDQLTQKGFMECADYSTFHNLSTNGFFQSFRIIC
jgi:hypothetical protein